MEPLETSREAIAIPEWFLLQSQPGKERNIVARLESAEVESYLPILPKRRAGGRGESCPLFPSYLFSFFPSQQLAFITDVLSQNRTTVGIGRIVHFGRQPAKVAQEIIDLIRAQENSDGKIDLEKSANRFSHGDAVRINSGVFAGMTGIFDKELNGQDRVRILLQSIQFNSSGLEQRGWNFISKFGGKEALVSGSSQSICVSRYDVVRA